MTRRDWLNRLAAAGAAGVVPGGELALGLGSSLGDHAAWLREALPALPAEPRRLRAYDLRVKAAFAAASASVPRRDGNTDESRVPAFLAMFSKGYPHDTFGIVDPEAYRALARAAVGAGDARFEDVPLAGARRLVSPCRRPSRSRSMASTSRCSTYRSHQHGSPPRLPPRRSKRTGWRSCAMSPSRVRRGPTRDPRGRRPHPRRPRYLARDPVLPRPDSRLPTPDSGGVPVPPARGPDGRPTAVAARAGARAAGESFLSTWDDWLASQNGQMPSRDVTYVGRRYICCGRDSSRRGRGRTTPVRRACRLGRCCSRRCARRSRRSTPTSALATRPDTSPSACPSSSIWRRAWRCMRCAPRGSRSGWCIGGCDQRNSAGASSRLPRARRSSPGPMRGWCSPTRSPRSAPHRHVPAAGRLARGRALASRLSGGARGHRWRHGHRAQGLLRRGLHAAGPRRAVCRWQPNCGRSTPVSPWVVNSTNSPWTCAPGRAFAGCGAAQRRRGRPAPWRSRRHRAPPVSTGATSCPNPTAPSPCAPSTAPRSTTSR